MQSGAAPTRCCTCGNKRSVIGEDGAWNKASSKERVSNLCIEHGGWVPRSSVCRCCHVQHSLFGMLGIECGDVLISLHSVLKPLFLCFSIASGSIDLRHVLVSSSLRGCFTASMVV
ncbi:hypothetical protein ACSQ67_016758 [Phaseolus vulgaris]